MKTMKKIIILSGISGAGKTTASNILEDMGYRCIDQYPSELLADLIELILQSDNYQNVVLSISISDLDKYSLLLENGLLDVFLILLDCKKKTAIDRYKFSRRVHPLLISNTASTLEEAIDIEKKLLAKYENGAHVIDTTSLSLSQHQAMLKRILNKENDSTLSISFVSFGFKYGVPSDADLVLDVRILKNPYYDADLRNMTGNDKLVQDYVLNNELGQNYLQKLLTYLDFTFAAYGKDKRHLQVCVGCTGGQHRSVTIANYLHNYYRDKYNCYLLHRELSHD